MNYQIYCVILNFFKIANECYPKWPCWLLYVQHDDRISDRAWWRHASVTQREMEAGDLYIQRIYRDVQSLTNIAGTHFTALFKAALSVRTIRNL